MVSFNDALSKDVADGTVYAPATARPTIASDRGTNTPSLRASGLEQALAEMDDPNRT